MSSAARFGKEEGSEPVSYVLVQMLVIMVFLALLQFSLIVHTRNTVISAAGEGARRYAVLGGSEEAARAYVSQTCDELLGPGRVQEIDIVREKRGGGSYEVAVVTVRSTLPIIWKLGPSVLYGQGSAIVEDSLP